MKKVLLPIFLVFGLYAGSASAIVLDPAFEVLTIGDGIIPSGGGLETDQYSQSRAIAANSGDVPVTHWIGIDVIAVFANATLTSETQSQPGGATENLNIELWSATRIGNDWTNVMLLDTALPSPMLAGLATGTYLVRIFGSLDDGPVDLVHNYGLRVTSLVPVPAAVWLFGTAIFGLIGLRRKAAMAATA